MSKLPAHLSLVGFLVMAQVARADLVVSLNTDNGHLVLNGMGEEVSGLQFVSPMGNLVPGTSPHPFAFFIPPPPATSPTRYNVVHGSLGTTVTVDGAIELDTGWMGPFPGDLQGGFAFAGPWHTCCEDGLGCWITSGVHGRADFGRVLPGEVSSATLDDVIAIRRLCGEPTLEILSLETAVSSIFEVVDFQPITLDDNQPEISFSVSVDLTAPPGIYFGVATFQTSEGPFAAFSSVTIVPEPVGSLIAVIASTGVLLLRRRENTPGVNSVRHSNCGRENGAS